MLNAPGRAVWESTALLLIRKHGQDTGDYCTQQIDTFSDQGRKYQALAWIEITYAVADLMAELQSTREPVWRTAAPSLE